MIDFSIKVNGEKAAALSLSKLDHFEDWIADEMGAWAIETLDGDLYGEGNYAPKPAGSTYVRTGNLGANWGVRRQGKTGVIFENNTDYGGYVVGDGDGAGQARHMLHWWLARRKVEDRIDVLAQRIERRADAI